MKKIVLYTTLFLFQIMHTSDNSRIIKRTCNLCYTDEHYRKDLGNQYLQEAIQNTYAHSAKEKKYTMQTQKTSQKQAKPTIAQCVKPVTHSIPSKFMQPNLEGILIVECILPSLYYRPKINSFEFLPKK